MNRLALIKLVLAAVAILVWGYGARVDNGPARGVAIGILAVAFALRFLPRPLKARLEGRGQPPRTDS